METTYNSCATDYSSRETFPDEGLVKYYDTAGRIIEIVFIRSGNGCSIQYVEPSDPSHSNERIVRWSTGQRYRTFVVNGETSFIQEG